MAFWIRETRTWHILEEVLDDLGDHIIASPACDTSSSLKVPEDPEHEVGVEPEHFPSTRDGGLICIRCAPMA